MAPTSDFLVNPATGERYTFSDWLDYSSQVEWVPPRPSVDDVDTDPADLVNDELEPLSPTDIQRGPKTRVINGVLYERDERPHCYRQRLYDLGNGHIEVSVQPRYGWHEVADLTDQARVDMAAADGHIFVSGQGWVESEEIQVVNEEHDKANRERSARRAKTEVRRKIKANNLIDLLTLTYHDNQTDRFIAVHDFQKFIKRLRRVWPNWKSVAIPETQKRGAWHWHLAIERLPLLVNYRGRVMLSYSFIRLMWQETTGDDGNVDVQQGTAKRSGRSGAALAVYMTKYVSKGFINGDNDGTNCYLSSNCSVPDAEIVDLPTVDHVEAALWMMHRVEDRLGAVSYTHLTLPTSDLV